MTDPCGHDHSNDPGFYLSGEVNELIDERIQREMPSDLVARLMKDATEISVTATEMTWFVLRTLRERIVKIAQDEGHVRVVIMAMLTQADFDTMLFSTAQPPLDLDLFQPARQVTLTGPLGLFVTCSLALVRPVMEAQYAPKKTNDITMGAILNIRQAWGEVQPQIAQHAPLFTINA